MTSWQKRARIGVAAIGIASAVVVYAAMGHRKSAAAAPLVQRLDPKAVLETWSGLLQQARGTKQDFTVASDRQLTYEDGSTKLLGVRISVKNRDGRDFVVTAKEAAAGKGEKTLQLTSDVKLVASDGFQLVTDRGSFNQDDGIVRADGLIEFARGGMRGHGTGMTYDKNNDVLSIAHDARVVVADAGGKTTMDFQAGAASLDRVHDMLAVDGAVHVMRNEQQIETDHATAQMSDKDDVVRSMELRGNSRVEGGGSAFDRMSARDINLYYSDDGQTLQHIAMSGGAAIALAAQNGGAAGRQLTAESLDLQLAPDGNIEHGVGENDFRMLLPATPDLPARSIQSNHFEAHGAAGQGLTDATFANAVVYREEARTTGQAARVARARELQVSMMGDAIANAVFRGSVDFEEQKLKATAGEAHYDPRAGTLALARGGDAANPIVADDQIRIEAQTIDVTLDTHAMQAMGGAKTMLLAGASNVEGGRHLPGLLKQNQSANVNADALEYDGAGGRAMYTGNASLWQGETAIRANSIAIDQGTGDLVATGAARAVLALDTGTSVSRADVIQYSDARHLVTYTMMPAAPEPLPPAPAVKPMAQMSGPQGNLTATRIEASLTEGGSDLQQLEAAGTVTLKLDTRTATGEHLTYHADTEQYDMTGSASAPVEVVDTCRDTTGKTLTFFRSTDRIIVDGNEQIRTQTKSGAACPQPRAR